METSVNEKKIRLLKAIRHLKYVLQLDTDKDVSNWLGYNGRSTFNVAMSRGSDSLCKAIASKSDNLINLDWLLYGTGSMLNELDSLSAGDDDRWVVPYYDVDFEGGFDLMYDDNNEHPSFYINCRVFGEVDCWCNLTGHSMEPELCHGDVIGLKCINDFTYLTMGEIYAIVTDNGMRTVKRLGTSQVKGCYRLIPTNKKDGYSDQDLPKNRITRVFKVVGCLKKV